MSYDHGLSGAAQRYYLLALHADREAGASALAAKVIGDMMQLSTSLGNYDDSLNLARAGLCQACALPRTGSAPIRAELLGLEARAFAQLGPSEAAEAVRSVETCGSVWHDRRDEPMPDWLHYMNQSEVDCLAANAYTQLALRAEDPKRWRRFAARAEQHTLSARSTRSHGYDRSRILDELRLANVRLAQREPAEAVAVAQNALAMAEHAHSSIVGGWLVRFNRELTERCGSLAVAAGFSGQLRDYLVRALPANYRKAPPT